MNHQLKYLIYSTYHRLWWCTHFWFLQVLWKGWNWFQQKKSTASIVQMMWSHITTEIRWDRQMTWQPNISLSTTTAVPWSEMGTRWTRECTITCRSFHPTAWRSRLRTTSFIVYTGLETANLLGRERWSCMNFSCIEYTRVMTDIKVKIGVKEIITTE